MRGILRASAVAAALTFSSQAHGAVTVALQPPTQTVAPGAEFDLFLVVTATGSPFNAFDAVVSYDAPALSPVALAPLSLQEGALMTGACANRFHVFETAVGRDSVTDVLLCSGVSVTGPGTIYRLRFQAGSTEQDVNLAFTRLRFFDAGILVAPVFSSGATVTIASTVGVDGVPTVAPRLVVSPNPSRGSVTVRIEGAAGGELRVMDARGRLVRKLSTRTWDGSTESGGRAAPGAYWIELRTGGEAVRARCVLIRD